MKRVINFIKSIKLKSVLTVFLAGSLLVISTACSDGNVAQTGGKAYTETAKRAASDTYDDYDANQSFKGGMNGYNDDTRYDSGTAAKVKGLIDTAKNRQTDDLGDYAEDIVDRAGNKIDRAKKDVPRAIKSNKDDAVKSIKNRTETLKDNVSNVPDEARKIVDGATDTAQDAVEDATKAAKRTAKEIKGNVKDLT